MATRSDAKTASLACVGEAYHLEEQAGPLWPGWDLASTPILLAGDDCSYLVGTNGAREGFRSFDGWALPLYRGPAQAGDDPLAALVTTNALDSEHPQGPAEFVGLILREAFAFHRAGRVPPYPGAAGRYPEASATNNVLGRIEGMLLHDLLTGGAGDEALTAFALVRRERRERLDDALVAVEQACEIRLGLGLYIELRAFLAATTAHYRPTAAFRALTGGHAGFQEVLGSRYEGLRAMNRGASRFAHTGMALALCLDRVYPGWAAELGPTVSLDDLVERKVAFDGGDNDEAVLLRAKERHGYFEEVLQERQWLRDLAGRREQLLAELFHTSGLKLVFDVSALDPALVTGHRRVEPLKNHILLYHGPCSFRFGPTTLEFGGVRLLEDRLTGLLQVATRPGRLRFEGDRRPFTLQIPAEFTGGLALDIPEVKVRARQGVLYDADGVLYVKLLR
ncbi:MAG: hypothetical protein RDU89_01790 [bacterium]|nr:hypothetical protein [bacterium]